MKKFVGKENLPLMQRLPLFNKTRQRFGRRSVAPTGRRPENRRKAI
jgi:hypothetical protein